MKKNQKEINRYIKINRRIDQSLKYNRSLLKTEKSPNKKDKLRDEINQLLELKKMNNQKIEELKKERD